MSNIKPTKPTKTQGNSCREGWAEAFKTMHQNGDDEYIGDDSVDTELLDESGEHSYIYPVIYHVTKDSIGLHFPDLPGCRPRARNLEEAREYAREALGLQLYFLDRLGKKRPVPTPINFVTIPDDYPSESTKELVEAKDVKEVAKAVAKQDEIAEVLQRLQKTLPPDQIPNEEEIAWRISWMKRWRGHITYPLRGLE